MHIARQRLDQVRRLREKEGKALINPEAVSADMQATGHSAEQQDENDY